MSWAFTPEFDAGHRAALEGGKPLVYVAPPAAWTLLPLFDRLADEAAGLRTLTLVPDAAEGAALAETLATRPALRPIHACTGLARTARTLSAGVVRTLCITPADGLQLLSRSQLPLDSLRHAVLVWPEIHLALGGGETLDAVLGACARVQRILVTGDETRLGDLLERHGYRAPVVPAARLPQAPLGPARYAVVPHDALHRAARTALDLLNPGSAFVWDPSPLCEARWGVLTGDPVVRVSADPGTESVDLALAVELPTADALSTLRSIAGQVVVFARANQVPYLHRLAQPLGVLRLPGEADRARERAFELRRAVRQHLEAAWDSAELHALAPLFDEHDPALVAAAAVRAAAARGGGAPSPEAEAGATAAWVRLRLDAGRRDRIRVGDVVGALLNAVGLERHQVGRVDVRDGFTLVDVRGEAAERALRGLDGVLLRGRRVAVRREREQGR